MKKAAYYISVIFHPLFIPLYITFFLFQRQIARSWSFAVIIYSLLLIDAVLLPYVFTRIVARKKNESIPLLISKQSRFWPLAFFIYSYAVLALLFYYLKIGFYLEAFFFSILGTAIATFVLNFFTKISLHMVAAGTVSGFIATILCFFKVDLVNVLSIVVAISGVVASSRLILAAHTPMEIYIGYAIGIIISVLVVLGYYQFYITHFSIY